jgi:archaeal chaperonin
MSIQQQQQPVPIFLLKEGTTETKGNQAQRNNITAAKTIAEIVRSSLGPRGMDKMLVNNLGDVTITNDGATILKEIDVQHPAAKMMVEISKATDNEVGDGTTSTVVLAGSLLSKAEELIAKGVHPTVIVDGYTMASEKAIEILRNASTKVDPADRQMLGKIARTSMASKLVSVNSEPLSKIVVDAVIGIAEKARDNNNLKVDADSIKVEKKAGGSVEDTKLIQGIVLDKEVVHGAMPKRIEDAKIALLNAALEIEKTEMSAEIRISDPQQMHMFLEEENRMLKSMVDRITASGANVLLCQKGIDDLAQHYLAKEGILAVRRVKESDMNNLAKAAEGRVLSNIDELSAADLGYAKLVEERKVETDKWVFVEGCKNPKAVSILIRGGSQRVVDEAERSVHDAIMAVKDVVEYPYITVGAGAPEVYISQKVREWSGSLSGRSQLAVEKFADSVEEIAIALAENAGMDPLDTQTQLRAKAALAKPKYGVDVINGKVTDMAAKDVYEPLKVKEQIINAATEVSGMILRIDDVIASGKSAGGGGPPGPPGGGMGGMGGMDM